MLDEKKAKEYVIKTILEGNKKRIALVVDHFNKAYGTKRPNEQKEDLRQTGTNDLVAYAEQIGLTESQT